MEQLDELLYRWFAGIGIDDPVWHPSAFTTSATGSSRAISRPPLGDRPPHHPAPRLSQSQQARHRIEEVFAWVKTIAGQGQTKHRGLDRVRWHFTLASAVCNLIRLPKLPTAAP